MTIKPRPYAGLDDLEAMKKLVIAGRNATQQRAYIHPGDLDWWLFYGQWQYDWHSIITLWEDERGELAGWQIFSSKACDYDIAIRPDLQDTACGAQMVEWAEAKLLPRAKEEGKPIGTAIYATETTLGQALEARGYRCQPDFTLFGQPLDVELPEPKLPEGFHFLEAMRPDLVDKRADVHFDAFNPAMMTPEKYVAFMQAPGYDPTLDVVVVAPDGRFAAFAMAWVDEETQSGEFEPVGTRHEMQRKGLGKAALHEGLRRMRARGMTYATVCTHTTDEGNMAFYPTAGFKIINTIPRYEKKV